MRTLYHYWLNPFSRKIRLVLSEKQLEFDLQLEKPWERREPFLRLNPAGDVPVLVEDDGGVLAESTAIVEYLEEAYPERPLLVSGARERAEIRRLVGWFDVKFNQEVTQNLVEEKITKRFLGVGQPNSQAIRAGYHNINTHLAYIGYLVDRRNYLSGDSFGLADIAAAAHISCIDYLGDVPWDDHQAARTWYARVKSRPSFRSLLADHVPGAAPPKHYADLDF